MGDPKGIPSGLVKRHNMLFVVSISIFDFQIWVEGRRSLGAGDIEEESE